MNRLSAVVIAGLLVVIAVLAWFLVVKPGDVPLQAVHTTPPPVATPMPPTALPVSLPLTARVKVTSPLSNAAVAKIFTVTGEAPGPWYFEGSFPVQVRDKDGNKIGQVAAQAQGKWMTEGQVPFTARLVISGTYAGSATLVLLKDNPSGMPENDDSISLPIVIK